MAPYRIRGGQGDARASDGAAPVAFSTCLFRVERLTASAFVDALLTAYSGAELIQQIRSATYDELVNARRYPPGESTPSTSAFVDWPHALGCVGLTHRIAPTDLEPLEVVVIRDYTAEELGLG